MKNIALIGAGGHCKVVIDIINELNNYNIVGIFDDKKVGIFCGFKILGNIYEINTHNINILIDVYVITIGNDEIRKQLYEQYTHLSWCTLIHPKSVISKNVVIGIGSVICASAVIQTEVQIGKHCIINTNCNIDHESFIGDFCSICPGSTICGQTNIGNVTFIGANSTIINCINIGSYCIIGAGSVVIKDVNDNCKVVGNPAKII